MTPSSAVMMLSGSLLLAGLHPGDALAADASARATDARGTDARGTDARATDARATDASAADAPATPAATPASHAMPAAGAPAVTEGDFVLRDFHFRSGETMPQLRLHYRTLGNRDGDAVLLLHGTAQSGAALLAPAFGGELFGPGQPLDARTHFIIVPDAIGHGASSKPSDGLRARFPHYGYDDQVEAQYRLVAEHLGVRHLRLVLGNSMGGMETWLFAQAYPDFVDVAVPMASTPAPMSGRNWMMRRLIVDSIRNDPQWDGGNYTKPLRSAQFASAFYGLATSGGDQALQQAAPTRAHADALLDARLAAPFAADANDVLYQWESSRDFDPTAGLAKIRATVLAINSTDDERNRPELGVMEQALARIPHASVHWIAGSAQTAGHGTTGQARWWKDALARVLAEAPRLTR